MTVEVLKPDFRKNAGTIPLHRPDATVRIAIDGSAYDVADLSLDGDAVVVFAGKAEVGQSFQATITFPLQDCHLTAPVGCKVTGYAPDKNQLRLRLRPDDEPAERELLGTMFRAVEAGDAISADDVLGAAQHRGAQAPASSVANASVGGPIRRRLGSIAFVLLAGTLVAFIVSNLATRAYVVQADGAVVNPQSQIERMPLTAELVSYAAPIGAPVPPKSTIAILRTKTGEILTISSDCNCVVGGQLATSPVFLNKGDPIVQLVPVDGTNHAVLSVPLEDMRRVRVGDKVTASFYDSASQAVGTVERVSVPKLLNGATGDASTLTGKIEVRFASKLPAWRVGEPVSARILLSRFNPFA